MKLGIMQPYLFPYLGYFQLIHAADTFVIYDDVQYKKGGWINRNRLLMNEKEMLFSFSVQSDSVEKNINERFFAPRAQREAQKFMKTLQMAYGKAPFFEETRAMTAEALKLMDLDNLEENIAPKIARTIKYISSYLKTGTNFIISSELDSEENLEGAERVIDIIQKLNAATYINAIGGRKLYTAERFKKEGIELFFIQPEEITYRQFSGDFIPWLSIIDVCMFNSRDKVRRMLRSYTLIQ